jgi:hypothetical protein
MKKLAIVLLIIILTCFLCCCFYSPSKPIEKIDPSISNKPSLEITDPLSKESQDCLLFINSNLSSSSGGIYTNYQNTDTVSDLSTGHEVLSESMGLLLDYAYLTSNEALFNSTSDYIFNNLMVDTIILWRIKEGDSPITDVSSTIDDLRIYDILIASQEKWPLNRSSEELIINLEDQLSTNIHDSKTIPSYYNNDQYSQENRVEMAYINLHALNTLSTIQPKLTPIISNNKTLLLNSYINNTLPLYHKYYIIDSKTYEDNDGKINTLDSLMVMLNLAKTNLYLPTSINWLKDKTSTGTLYSTYDTTSGEALDQQESSASYGIAIQIGVALGDKALCETALNQLKMIQNKDSTSPLYGSFGYHNNAYSYDNLHGLIGLIYND